MLVIQTLAKSVKAADPALIKLFHESDVYSPDNSPCEELFQMSFLLEVLAGSLVSSPFKTQVYEHYGAVDQRSGKWMSTVVREGGLPHTVVKKKKKMHRKVVPRSGPVCAACTLSHRVFVSDFKKTECREPAARAHVWIMFVRTWPSAERNPATRRLKDSTDPGNVHWIRVLCVRSDRIERSNLCSAYSCSKYRCY